MTVPIVSKKSESMIEKIVTTAVRTPARAKTEKSSPAPRLEKSGHASRRAGTTAWPGSGNARPPVHALTPIASAVVTMMPSRSPPVVPRAWNHSISRRPNSETATGAEVKSPSVSGTPGGPVLTMPAALKPMKRMKSPMPTPMARFSETGMAFMIASRNPVSTNTVMASPSSTTTPMAACQGSFMPATSWKATAALSPIPEASASG